MKNKNSNGNRVTGNGNYSRYSLLVTLFLVFAFCLFTFAFFGHFAFAADELVSINLKDAQINTALNLLAEQAGINIIAREDIEGKVSVSLTDVPLNQALDAILKETSFTYLREGNIARIIPSVTSAPRMVSLGGGSYTKTFFINYLDPDDIKNTLSDVFPTIKLITTKGSKLLVVEGNRGIIKRVENLIRSLDVPPMQVMVEAKLIEINHSSGAKMGVEAKYTNPNRPTEIGQTTGLADDASATAAEGLYYSVTNTRIDRLLEMFQTKTGYNLLSSPKVLALNNEKAEMMIGSRYGYKVKTVTTTGVVESVEFMDVGTKLVITPSIKSDGYILMEIHPEISTGDIKNDLPQKKSTETTTKLLVKDGQTIVIGGLISDYVTETKKGIPVLADIPVLGMFFRRTEAGTEKREIVIFISPHIVTTELIDNMGKTYQNIDQQREKTDSTFEPLKLVR